MSDKGNISAERRGPVFLIGIDRPDKRNAFSLDMYLDLGRALGELDRDPELRCGVLFAHGDHFTAGLDLPEWTGAFASGSLPVCEGGMCPMGLYGDRVRKPVVFAAQGLCLTIGIELMLATDIRVAAANTRFGQIEVKRGIYPVGGATLRFHREAGWGNAMRYLLTGDEFDAGEALRMGLIQEIVEPGEQLDRAVAIATNISEQAPLGVQATLASARREILEGEVPAARRLIPDLQPLLASEDVQEGIASFVERRKARFQGR